MSRPPLQRFPLKSAILGLSVVLLALSLNACKRDPVAKTRTPEGSIQAGADALQQGDLRAFVESQVPPEELAKLRADWQARAKKPVDPAEAKRFAESMEKFAASDASEKLLAELEPKLAEFEREGAAQMPMLIGMMTGMAQASITQNKDLDEAGKARAMQMVNVLTRWLSAADFTDRAKVRASIDALTEAARSSKVRTLPELNALDFDAALDEYSRGFRALKSVLATYGLPLDPVFASVKAKTVSQDDSTAKLQLSYRMLDTDFTHDLEMVKRGDRWYGRKTAQQVGEMLKDEDADDAPATDAAGAPPEIAP